MWNKILPLKKHCVLVDASTRVMINSLLAKWWWGLKTNIMHYGVRLLVRSINGIDMILLDWLNQVTLMHGKKYQKLMLILKISIWN